MPGLTDAQRRIAELTALNALARTLNRVDDMREALDAALVHIVELVGVRTGWIFLREDVEGYRLVARRELPPAIHYPGPAWADVCTCQELCTLGRLNKAVSLVHCSRLKSAVGDKRGLVQHASIPLRNGDEILGILNVATNEFVRLHPPQIQILSTVGYMLGTAIARMRLYEQVKVRRVHEQRTLFQLSQELLGASSLEPALQRLVRVGARLLEADACAFVEANEQRGCATLMVAHGWRFLPPNGLPVVLDPANPHLWYLPENSMNLGEDVLDNLPPLLQAQGFQGHLALVVTINGMPIGTFMINTRTQRQFLEDEAQLLGLLGSQLAQTLERERLHQESLVRHRLEQELDLARDIQASFLPAYTPEIHGYSLARFYRPARQVGGDFYDFIALTETPDSAQPGEATLHQTPKFVRRDLELDFWRTGVGTPRISPRSSHQATNSLLRLGIVIADVTDKGVPAALFMALSRTLMRATASDGRPPRAVLERANQLLLADARSGLFVTAFYGILDIESGAFTYANGGHNYPLLYRAATGQVEQLQAMGIVLGIIPDPRFEQQSTKIEPGDVLCLYTDGVTEAMDIRRQLFDEHRLTEVLRRSHHLPPDQIIDQIIESVTRFTGGALQGDDITLVVLKRNVS